MSKNIQEEVVVNEVNAKESATPTQPQTVPMEAYESLYKQAIALETRYKKLFELYNTLLEAYLSK